MADRRLPIHPNGEAEPIDNQKWEKAMNEKEDTQSTALIPLSQSKSFTLADLLEEEDKELDFPLFLPRAWRRPEDEVFMTPFIHIANVFKMRGLESFRLRAAIVMWLALNSAHLGNPFTVEIIDPSDFGALSLLDMAQKATCREFIKSFAKLDLRTLADNPAALRGTTIVGENSSGFKKVGPDLNRLLATQHLSTHLPNTRGGIGQDVEISGPIGCVMLTKEPPSILSDFSFLTIFLDSEENLSLRSLSEEDQASYDTLCGLIKMSIRRIKPRLVSNPFESNPAFFAADLRRESERRKIETLGRMMRLIHLINNPPPVYRSEVFSYMWEVPQDSLKLLSRSPSQASTSETSCNKLDYLILWSLMFDLLRKNDVYLTPRQQSIMRIMADRRRSIKNPDTWQGPEEILGIINDDGREPIESIKVLCKELKEMSEKGVIKEGKGISGNHYQYLFDTTRPAVVPLQLLAPRSLVGYPCIKVMNPITNEIDEM